MGQVILKLLKETRRCIHIKTWYYSVQCGCMVPAYIWIFCGWPSRNCLPEVTITANSPSSIQQTIDSFLSSYDNSSVANFFADTTYKRVFPTIDGLHGVVDSIVDSQIVLLHFFNSHDTADYYIGLPSGSRLTDDWDAWITNARCVLRIKDRR
ncbi:MAG: hypothetical protein Q8M08_16160 [Bacteroidales bacterium]|nr:hypothetical protein [Bacteroidales bacterium]